MRHQSKRKYADRKKLNRKYHSQKAYRKEQKRKTGWRARWDKFTDRHRQCVYDMFPTHDTDFHRLYDFL